MQAVKQLLSLATPGEGVRQAPAPPAPPAPPVPRPFGPPISARPVATPSIHPLPTTPLPIASNPPILARPILTLSIPPVPAAQLPTPAEPIYSPTSVQPQPSLVARRQLPLQTPYSSCTACRDVYPRDEVFEVPCGHLYCKACLSRQFVEAGQSEMRYPARCCRKTIPLPVAFLDLEVFINYQQKQLEYSTINRTYCSRLSCHTFILPCNVEEGLGYCHSCGYQTCTTCKEEAHPGKCTDNLQYQQFLQRAQSEGWKRCYACNRMVELTTGCSQMM